MKTRHHVLTVKRNIFLISLIGLWVASAGLAIAQPKLAFGPNMYERIISGPFGCIRRAAGKDLTNQGDAGDVFVSVTWKGNKEPSATKVFHMEAGEKVKVWYSFGCRAFGTLIWKARLALPFDTSKGRMSVERYPRLSPIPDQITAQGSAFTPISLDEYVSDGDTNDAKITWSYEGNRNLQQKSFVRLGRMPFRLCQKIKTTVMELTASLPSQ